MYFAEPNGWSFLHTSALQYAFLESLHLLQIEHCAVESDLNKKSGVTFATLVIKIKINSNTLLSQLEEY
jgi:hypothetical protein